MNLNKSEFNRLIKAIPTLPIDIVWEGSEGNASVEDYNVEVDVYSIYFDAQISAQASYDPGDFYTPPYFEVESVIIDVLSSDLFLYSNDKHITLTQDQKNALNASIEENISV